MYNKRVNPRNSRRHLVAIPTPTLNSTSTVPPLRCRTCPLDLSPRCRHWLRCRLVRCPSRSVATASSRRQPTTAVSSLRLRHRVAADPLSLNNQLSNKRPRCSRLPREAAHPPSNREEAAVPREVDHRAAHRISHLSSLIPLPRQRLANNSLLSSPRPCRPSQLLRAQAPHRRPSYRLALASRTDE